MLLSPCTCLLQETPEVVGPALGRAEPLQSLEQIYQQGKTDHGRPSPLPSVRMAWLPKSSGTCPMGLCKPAGGLGNAVLGYSAETSAENMVWGLCSMGASLPPHHGPVSAVHKKSVWPICSWGHGAQPASRTIPGGQKAFLFPPAAAEHTKEGDQYLSTITVSFKCPQPP